MAVSLRVVDEPTCAPSVLAQTVRLISPCVLPSRNVSPLVPNAASFSIFSFILLFVATGSSREHWVKYWSGVCDAQSSLFWGFNRTRLRAKLLGSQREEGKGVLIPLWGYNRGLLRRCSDTTIPRLVVPRFSAGTSVTDAKSGPE